MRQIRNFKRMNLPGEVEIILVDDGSDPPLNYETCGLRNLRILYTNDKRPWTQGLARNAGARAANGAWILFTDIDHILTREVIEEALKGDYDKMVFPRHFGVLDRHGRLVCDKESMLAFGLDPARWRRNGYAGTHGNTYSIRKAVFEKLGGYDPYRCTRRFHMGGKFGSEESHFNLAYNRSKRRGQIGEGDRFGPKIYHYPVSKFRADRDNNPYGLFHQLSLEQVPQPDKK